MDSSEPLHYVSVPLRRSVWRTLRELAARERKPMSELCAQWVQRGVAARDAERGRGLSAADDVSPAA